MALSLDNLTDDVVAGYWDWNIRQNTLHLSERFKAMFGYQDHELESSVDAWRSIILPEDLALIQQSIREHINSKGKIPFNKEVRHKHKNGSVVWGNCMGLVVEWYRKEPIRMVGCHIKTPRAKVMDDAAKIDLHEKTSKSAHFGIWEWDFVNNLVYWNSVIRKIYQVSDHYQPDFKSFIHFVKEGEDRQKLSEAINFAINFGVSFDVECRLVTVNGQTKWVRIVGESEFFNNNCTRLYGSLQDIDQQKRVQYELQLSEEQFRSSFENSAIGMALVSLNGKCLKANRQLCDMLGYSQKELLDRYITDVTHPDDVDEDLSLVARLLNGQIETYRLEKRYITKGGRVVWVLLNVSLVKDHFGEPVHFVSQIENISLRKEAEQALIESETNYRHIFENIQDVFYQTDKNGFITEVSPSVEKLTGLSRKQVIGSHVNSFYVNPNDKLKISQSLKVNGKINDYHLRLKQGSDGVVYTSANIQMVYNSEGDVVGVEGSLRDITESKKAEKALVERDSLLTNLSEQVPGAIFKLQCFLDGRSSLPFASRGLFDIFEINPEDVKNDASRMFERIHFDDVERLKKSIITSYKDQTKWELEFRVTLPLKGARWLTGVAKPQLMADKSAIWYGYITDITEQKSKEQDLKHTFDLVTEQNNRLINFAYIISHNLRTHSGNFEMLVDLIFDTNNDADRRELLNHLKKVSSQLSETILHLNDVVSIQTSIDQERTKLNLYKYVEKTKDLLAMNLNQCGGIIDNQVPSGLEIEYNAAYIESILFNFLSNAIKYRHPERPPFITIGTECKDDRVVLVISDNGRGLDLKKNGDKLFGMFKTFHGNTDAKGIGLFITKNQIEAMGGKIEVESAVDEGTTFKVYLTRQMMDHKPILKAYQPS
jgi:PAS domain S-box-containing protein